jgi:glycerophosphoryl diester phosphodiesterase
MCSKIKLILISCCFIACQRIEYFEPQEATFDETKVLGHAAVGYSEGYKNNTLIGAKYGLSRLDGIEIDIAISKDNGLWLAHDSKVVGLDKYFINVTDQEISEIVDENGNPYYDKLEDVLKYVADSTSDKTISLDVKFPTSIFANSIFEDAAKKIGELVSSNGLASQVVVESGSVNFLNEIEKQEPDIGTYIMCYGNYEGGIADAYKNGFTGISFNYNRDDELTQESVDLAHDLGIKVLVYTINDLDINVVHQLGVDIIETDHMNYYTVLDQF